MDYFKNRMFDGKKYKHYIMTHNKKQAEKAKNSLKTKGNLARITKGKDKSGVWYDVWKK